MPANSGGLDERTARIVARVRAIPAGFVRTYGDIDPRAPRLVGRILATTYEDLESAPLTPQVCIASS